MLSFRKWLQDELEKVKKVLSKKQEVKLKADQVQDENKKHEDGESFSEIKADRVVSEKVNKGRNKKSILKNLDKEEAIKMLTEQVLAKQADFLRADRVLSEDKDTAKKSKPKIPKTKTTTRPKKLATESSGFTPSKSGEKTFARVKSERVVLGEEKSTKNPLPSSTSPSGIKAQIGGIAEALKDAKNKILNKKSEDNGG